MIFGLFSKKSTAERFLEDLKKRLVIHIEFLKKAGYQMNNHVLDRNLPSFSWSRYQREIKRLKSIDKSLIDDLIRMHSYNLLLKTRDPELANKIMGELQELHKDIELMYNWAGDLKDSNVKKLVQTLISDLESFMDFMFSMDIQRRVTSITLKELTTPEFQELKKIVANLRAGGRSAPYIKASPETWHDYPQLPQDYDGKIMLIQESEGPNAYMALVALGPYEKNLPYLKFGNYTLLGWYANSFLCRDWSDRYNPRDPPYFNHKKRVMIAVSGIIYILEPFRNQGIARKLIEFMELTLKKYGYGNMEANVENRNLIQLFQRLGFQYYRMYRWGKLL